MKAWELLSNQEAWTQGRAARDRQGNGVAYDDPDACCFCLVGAIFHCYPTYKERVKACEKVESTVGSINLEIWNDRPGRSWAEVYRVLKEADV